MPQPSRERQASKLLTALRDAGCDVWIDAAGDLMVSPPGRQGVHWPSDPERAIDKWRPELKALVSRECGGERIH